MRKLFEAIFFLHLGVLLKAENGYNNFHFISSNTVYGSKLPQKIKIMGTYYMDIDNYHDHHSLKNINYFKTSSFSIKNVIGKGPWICIKNTAKILANITDDYHKVVETNLNLMDKAADNMPFSFLNVNLNPKHLIDISDCQSLKIKSFSNPTLLSTEYAGKVYEFEIEVNFKTFTPVIFVDYFGMAAFNYKQKIKVQDPLKDRGHPLRYCDGSKFDELMYTPEPRPVCPTELSDHRVHERGVLTVYKPNIVPITRKINRCQEGSTFLYSGKSPCCFAERYDNRPIETVKKPTSKDVCDRMIHTKTSPSGNLTGFYAGTTTMNDFATNNNKVFDYGGAFDFSSHSKTVYDHFLKIAQMQVIMPTLSIHTPWGSIPRNYLYKNSYSVRDSRYNWEPFKKEDLCLYVPRLTAEVEAVHYPFGDNLVETSSSSGAVNSTFFISEKVKGAWSVDNTMLIKDLSKFNCVKKGVNDKLYITKSGDILKWQKGKIMRPAAKSPQVAHLLGTNHQDHGHSSFVEITKVDGTVNGLQNKHYEGHDPGDNSTIDVSKTPAKTVRHPPSIVTTAAPPGTTTPQTPPGSGGVQWQEAFAYMQYQQTEIQNANIHARVISDCHQSQLEWDMFVQLLDISPSIAIGRRIRQAVQATHGGNGFYVVKKCELVTSNSLMTTLFTNDTVEYSVNGVLTPFRELVAKLGVYPSDGKCLSYPLVKFKMAKSNHELVGQLTRDGSINTNSIKLLESCHGSRSLVFNLNNMTYFFRDYQLLGRANTNEVMKKITNIEQGSSLIKGGAVLNPIDEFINTIHLIHIVDPLEETKFKHYPTGHTVTDRYDMMERQSSFMSLLEMQEESTRAKFADKIWIQRRNIDYTGKEKYNGFDATSILDFFATSAKGVVNIADDIASGIGSGIESLASGVGGAIGDIGGGVGSAVESVGGGVGSAVGEIGKGVGSGVGALGKGLSGILTSIIIPVVVVIVIVVGGYFIYTKFIANEPEKVNLPPSYNEAMRGNTDDEMVIGENGDNNLRKRKM